MSIESIRKRNVSRYDDCRDDIAALLKVAEAVRVVSDQCTDGDGYTESAWRSMFEALDELESGS